MSNKEVKNAPNKKRSQPSLHVRDAYECTPISAASRENSGAYNPELVQRYFEQRHKAGLETARNA
jgi:hypothetical protein